MKEKKKLSAKVLLKSFWSKTDFDQRTPITLQNAANYASSKGTYQVINYGYLRHHHLKMAEKGEVTS